MAETTFILVGGNDRKPTSVGYGLHLQQEVTRRVQHPRILSCFFSWPQEVWEAKAQE